MCVVIPHTIEPTKLKPNNHSRFCKWYMYYLGCAVGLSICSVLFIKMHVRFVDRPKLKPRTLTPVNQSSIFFVDQSLTSCNVLYDFVSDGTTTEPMCGSTGRCVEEVLGGPTFCQCDHCVPLTSPTFVSNYKKCSEFDVYPEFDSSAYKVLMAIPFTGLFGIHTAVLWENTGSSYAAAIFFSKLFTANWILMGWFIDIYEFGKFDECKDAFCTGTIVGKMKACST